MILNVSHLRVRRKFCHRLKNWFSRQEVGVIMDISLGGGKLADYYKALGFNMFYK